MTTFDRPAEPWSHRGRAGGRRRGDASAGVDVRALAARARHPGLRARRGGPARAGPRRTGDAFDDGVRARSAPGVDVYYAGKAFLSRRGRPLGARGGPARRHRDRRRARGRAARRRPRRATSACTATTSPTPRSRGRSTAGVGRIIVDSLVEIDRVADAVARARGERRRPVMVRVTTGRARGRPRVHLDGARGPEVRPLDRVARRGQPAMRGAARRAGAPRAASCSGIHSHIGSQILDPSGFEVAARAVLDAARRSSPRAPGVLVAEVDLGGGYGIAYLPGEVAARPGPRSPRTSPASVAGAARRARHARCRGSRSSRAARSSAPPALTLYTVGTVKPVAARRRARSAPTSRSTAG